MLKENNPPEYQFFSRVATSASQRATRAVAVQGPIIWNNSSSPKNRNGSTHMVYPFPGAEEKEYMELLFATYVYRKYKTHKFMPELSLSSYFFTKKADLGHWYQTKYMVHTYF